MGTSSTQELLQRLDMDWFPYDRDLRYGRVKNVMLFWPIVLIEKLNLYKLIWRQRCFLNDSYMPNGPSIFIEGCESI